MSRRVLKPRSQLASLMPSYQISEVDLLLEDGRQAGRLGAQGPIFSHYLIAAVHLVSSYTLCLRDQRRLETPSLQAR